ncbi:MAG: hypothetical protein JST61_06500 [Acidobacteria bacterium]|nr:hypothetical protein [Acidobacteriota bacterium]
MKTIRYAVFLFATFFVIHSSPAHAQIAIYDTVGGGTFNSAPNNLGVHHVIGAYISNGFARHTISVGGDFRASLMGRDGYHYNTFAVGPRISFNPHVIRLHPYAEGLVGLANYKGGKNASSSNHLSYQIVGGMDATIFPHFDWRVVDLSYNATTGQDLRSFTAATGIVFRFR